MVGLQRPDHLDLGKSLARYMVVLHQRHFQAEDPKYPSTREVLGCSALQEVIGSEYGSQWATVRSAFGVLRKR